MEAHPTILVYLPRSNAQQVVFRLKDESKNLIYEQLLPISDQAGIVAIQLPETAPALVINQNYQWFLTLQTEELITPASPFVDAWIKRVEPGPDLAAALMDANLMRKGARPGRDPAKIDQELTELEEFAGQGRESLAVGVGLRHRRVVIPHHRGAAA